ncbi:MAG: sensor histidine kinase [Chloroflexi bacterium]|nr:sensor histidine kinase [Chloroflexota bacterium]
MTTSNQTLILRDFTDRWLRLIRLAWITLAILASGVFVASLPGYLAQLPAASHFANFESDPSAPWLIFVSLISVLISISASLLSLTLAGVLYRHKPKDRMAVFLSFFLLLYGVGFTGPLESLIPIWPDLASDAYLVVASLVLGPPTIALIISFPDGRFIFPWTRWLVLLAIPIVPLGIVLENSVNSIANPIVLITAILALGVLINAIVIQIYRYRNHSTYVERQQSKWVVYGLGLWILFMGISTFPYARMQLLPPGTALPWWVPAGTLIWSFSLIFLPISLAISVMRFRLYDIDIIINRTLVYGILSASILGLYVVAVGYLGNLVQAQSRSIIAFLTTGLIAVMFQPLRERLQRGVNRIMFGERENPMALLTKLGQQLEDTASPQAALTGIVETIAQTLKLPYSAIEFGKGEDMQIIASFGKHPEEVTRFPITYQAENIGFLVVALRSPGEEFGGQDITLLENIARQAGTAAQAAKLTTDLQLSRLRLVTAREEERRRLRRDLHDGLGPVLASQGLKMAAARQLLETDPAKAIQILDKLADQTENTVSEIRRLVYDLRPATLDDLGLVGAVSEYAAGLNINPAEANNLKVAVLEPDGGLPVLPAAIEVAAYRIATEALTNVSRHAQARTCSVTFKLIGDTSNKILEVEISDDGVGFLDVRKAGVGLTSMRERTDEVGGKFQIASTPNLGTRVSAYLPLLEM